MFEIWYIDAPLVYNKYCLMLYSLSPLYKVCKRIISFNQLLEKYLLTLISKTWETSL